MTKFVVDTHDFDTRRDGRGFGKHDKDRHRHRVIQYLTVQSLKNDSCVKRESFFIWSYRLMDGHQPVTLEVRDRDPLRPLIAYEVPILFRQNIEVTYFSLLIRGRSSILVRAPDCHFGG